MKYKFEANTVHKITIWTNGWMKGECIFVSVEKGCILLADFKFPTFGLYVFTQNYFHFYCQGYANSKGSDIVHNFTAQ